MNELEQLRSEVARLREESLQLRLLLWLAHSDGTAYGDDGEMQLWGIDFRRQPPIEIQQAIQGRRIKEFMSLEKEKD